MNIKKGDTVKIIKGRDRGKTGKVMSVVKRDSAVLVEGLNQVKKHVRPKKQGESGQIVLTARPLHIGKVMLVCPACHKAVRVGHAKEGDKKIRICRKCKAKV